MGWVLRSDARRTTGVAPYGWAPLVVLFLVGLVDRVEHHLLSALLPLIQAGWRLGDTAAGALPLASALAAVVVMLPAGYVADRHRRTRVVAVAVVCWSVATLGTGMSTGIGMFVAVRLLLAGSAGVYAPMSGSLLADFYPPRTRALAYGWHGIAPHLAGIGTVLGGLLGQAFGWRAAFVLVAVPGLVVAWLCRRLPEPARGGLDRLAAGAPRVPDFRRQLRRVIAVPTLVLTALGLAVLAFGLAGIFYWMPTMIHRDYGLGTGTAAAISGSITVVGVLTGMLAGTALGRRCEETWRAGRLLVGGGGIVCGGLVFAACVAMPGPVPFAALLLASTAFMAMAIPNLTACVPAVVGPASRGLAFAVTPILSAVCMAFGPLVVGALSERFASIGTAMYVLTVPLVVGGAVTLVAIAWYERDAARMSSGSGP